MPNCGRSTLLRMLVVLIVLVPGCPHRVPASMGVFTAEDRAALEALCTQPPYPSSYSALQDLATGHLRAVLTTHRFLSAAEYTQAISGNNLAELQDRAGLVVMERINGRQAAGVLLMVFTPDPGADLFSVDAMRVPSEIPTDRPTLLAHYPFNWRETDKDPDHVLGWLEVTDLHAKGDLVDREGQPKYDFRWGDP